MAFSLTWLPAVLEDAGLKVALVPGWRDRGRAEMGTVSGVMCHHTAGAANGNMPSLDLLLQGRPQIPGPLSQLGLGRDGTFYVLATGRANHAGEGAWSGLKTGNSSFIGIEAEHTGRPEDAWPDVQMDAYRRGVAALLAHLGADVHMCVGHKEYALPPGRKIDPTFDMARFRLDVALILAGRVERPALIPAVDARRRPTLRRGSDGEAVKQLQQKLGLDADGRFGAATEAAVRVFQRDRKIVPDGIVGPKSWEALDGATPVPGPAAAPSPAPAATAAPPTAAGAASVEMPPVDDAAHPVTVSGGWALTPDGKRFAKAARAGFQARGETSLDAWLASGAAPAARPGDSLVRVVQAICGNEGGLEAVNSYDGCFMSSGIFQWTAGLDAEPGELAVLLAQFKLADPDACDDCFGRHGLASTARAGDVSGRLTLAGQPLDSAASKAPLRSPEWAYRFWRAGHHPAFRSAQLALAASRVGRFSHLPVAGRPLDEWLTSEYGIALLLDEHVNRPGHVPGTLGRALDQLLGDGTATRDPGAWTQADESRLIDAYLAVRATTSMTDSEDRAGRIGEHVRTGRLSDQRGSFRT